MQKSEYRQFQPENHEQSHTGSQSVELGPVEIGNVRAQLKTEWQLVNSASGSKQIMQVAAIAGLFLATICAILGTIGLSQELAPSWAALILFSATIALACAWTLKVFIISEEDNIEHKEVIEEHIESAEHVSDVEWQLRDGEARYRDLLDCQDDIIIRRNRHGALTFCNSAFVSMFGELLDARIGKRFSPELIEGDETPSLDFQDGQGRRSYLQYLKTANGHRWYEWEEFAIHDDNFNIVEYQSIGRDVTEQKQIEDQLQEARDQSESANKAKSQFLATISHEIRTPMNGILGMTALMTDTTLSPEQKTYCRAINSSAKSLLSLIDQILDFSKIEAGKLELNNQSLDLRETAQSVIELLAPRAHDKGLEIAWFIDPSLPQSLIGDEVRIRQILTNLIGNAVKFTETGGITVEILNGLKTEIIHNPFAKTDGEEQPLIINVRDTGIGLTKKACEVIFDDFEQADNSHARRFEGTGLGLSITKHIVEKMNGEIKVISELEKGSEFQITINLERPQGAGHLYQSYLLPEEPHNILIVGELEIEMKAMARTLKAAGMSARYTNPAEAIRTLKSSGRIGKPFDVLIMDTDTAHKRLKKLSNELNANFGEITDSKKPIEIVLMDASERGEFPNLCAQGVDAYLTRPVRAVSLFARINANYGGVPLKQVNQIARETKTESTVKTPDTGPTILLAEDNDINALLARTVLGKLGANVIHVENGEAAVEKVRALNEAGRPLDCILMDIHMPEMDGFTATEQVRSYLENNAISIHKTLPIIAMTANAFPEDKEKCLSSGMNDHLAKPFESDQLKEMLDKWKVGLGVLKTGQAPLQKAS